jgi:plasmid stability protein
MRTSINLDDELLTEVKHLAAKSGRSMTAVIEDALRAMLSQKKTIAERPPVYLTTVTGSGLQPGVDLDDTASLLALMDEDNDSA